MAVVNQQITSSSPVDVQWPPPPYTSSSSVFVSQSVTNDKLNLNSATTFDDIDPFANWPPRPSGFNSNNNNNNNGHSISSDGFGTQNLDFSSNNKVIGSKPYQESVPSINKKQSSLNKMVSGNTPNLGIGSIFVSANSTAPKLAPPPLTAIGRGRGRNQISLSSQTKPPSSEQSPILDLL
ncbi:hypothetical protein MA16_Dca006577 [Dendrobium catenatum]|uniref:Uncharacterized protein n=2 Tax=Dendrobium catenatum TaxID=906689 RepID=A0A2I0XGY2_9ASPA|nr:hypothetical protein MA16_Dca006577 [Dendrobium catenatum]